ncbi:hypothetical protein BC829DRAFT_418083 [Chytridium lagenaria]|nr:hypothetical protein BC829DRAFT_418083 [Chytridium lagenaria]
MLSNIANSGPAIILNYDADRKIILLHAPSPEQSRWTQPQLEEHCIQVFRIAMDDCGTHHDRLIYALAGRIFTINAPRPIGGKKNPGFAEYSGSTTADLMAWIVAKAAEPPNTGRGRKRTTPGEALSYVVENFNELMALQRNRNKDAMDDVILKGMTKAGHIERSGRIVLPQYLREDGNSPGDDAESGLSPEEPGSLRTPHSSSSSNLNPASQAGSDADTPETTAGMVFRQCGGNNQDEDLNKTLNNEMVNVDEQVDLSRETVRTDDDDRFREMRGELQTIDDDDRFKGLRGESRKAPPTAHVNPATTDLTTISRKANDITTLTLITFNWGGEALFCLLPNKRLNILF